MTPLLEVRDLHVELRTELGIVRAVNGVSFSLEKGQSLAIVGESGSGKSVSVLSILGLMPKRTASIPRGQVIFDGNDLVALSDAALRNIRGRRIAMVFQDPMNSLNPLLPIGRQLTEVTELHLGLDRRAARVKAIKALEMVGIPDAARRVDDYPHEFSGGQRQRIGIAMALSCDPDILIADEPTTALDVTVQAQILRLVRDLMQRIGMSVIWISHDLGVVAGLVDRVAVMYAGKIVEIGDVYSIFARPSHPYTIGLLGCVPATGAFGGGRLASIEGLPPDMTARQGGCAFAPRCAYAEAACFSSAPPMVEAATGHFAACWRSADIRAGAASEVGTA